MYYISDDTEDAIRIAIEAKIGEYSEAIEMCERDQEMIKMVSFLQRSRNLIVLCLLKYEVQGASVSYPVKHRASSGPFEWVVEITKRHSCSQSRYHSALICSVFPYKEIVAYN